MLYVDFLKFSIYRGCEITPTSIIHVLDYSCIMIYICLHLDQFNDIIQGKQKVMLRGGTVNDGYPFWKYSRFRGKLPVVYQKTILEIHPFSTEAWLLEVANTTCLSFFGLSINSSCFQWQGWEDQWTVFTPILGMPSRPTKQIAGHWIQVKGTTQWIQWAQVNQM